MTSPIFNKAIIFSVLGHVTIFSLFNFSFGQRVPKLDFANIYSLGAILQKADLASNRGDFNAPKIKNNFFAKAQARALLKADNTYPALTDYYLKPQFDIIAGGAEKVSLSIPAALPVTLRAKESPLVFHPRLPEHFLIFFNDRETVHIELMYNVVPRSKTNIITLKRKISSGNLEADLLSMRYIGHYLFTEQSKFMMNKWQTVKIDLSAKND
ncbi:MAG: hypothetical protein PHQ57_00870 [Candidatus Omnitrophica bacterium]|nr:hypothetical protein [Candidatus Omnitrophota bacterium]